MSQTMLVGFDGSTEQTFCLNLTTYVGTGIISKKNENEAIEVLKIVPNIDLIVAKAQNGENKIALKIYQFLQFQKREVPMIIIGTEPELEEKAISLPEGSSLKDMVRAAAGVLGVTAEMMAAMAAPEYFPIPVNYFVAIPASPCDVFIRVTKKQGAFHYIKLFFKDKEIENSEMEKYKAKGVQSFYVPGDFRLKFVNAMTGALIGKLTDDNISTEERMTATAQGMNIIAEEVGMKVDGINESTVDMAKACIQSVLKLVGDTPKLSTLLKNLMNNKSSYLYRHSQLITFLSYHAIENLDWGTSEQKEKLAFVSLFHDITLTTDEMCQIHSDSEMQISTMPDDKKSAIYKHAAVAAELVRNFPRAPIGADIIIQQHHASRSGNGFSQFFGNNLSPLAIVFIVCEDFAHRVLKLQNPTSNEITVIVKDLKSKYISDKYQKVAESFKTLKF